MHPEDIVRIRESQEVDQLKLENEQHQLIEQVKQVIRKKTMFTTADYNDVLRQAIDVLKQSNV